MILAYLLFGIVLWASYDLTPAALIADLQADPSRPPRRRELLAVVVLCCLAVAAWPVALTLRAACAVRRRLSNRNR